MLNVAGEAAIVITDVPYKRNPDLSTKEGFIMRSLHGDNRQLADIYLPATPITRSTPVYFFVHGGGWIRGHRAANNLVKAAGGTFSVYGGPPQCNAAASMGFVAISTGYRVGEIATILADVATSLKWFSDKANLSCVRHGLGALADDFKIVLAGHSAGAHVAMMLATDPSYLAAVGMDVTRLAGICAFSGPYTVRNPFNSSWRNAVFQRMYVDKAFPADVARQDEYSPTWRIAQRVESDGPLTTYYEETKVAPGWFESASCTSGGGGSKCGSAVREQPTPQQIAAAAEVSSSTSKAVSTSAATAAAASTAVAAAASPVAVAVVGSATHGFGKQRVTHVGPTLFETHGLPAIVLCGTSDLGLEHDAQRLYSFLCQLKSRGYDPDKKVRFAQIAGASHASINREPLTREVLVKLINELMFPAAAAAAPPVAPSSSQ